MENNNIQMLWIGDSLSIMESVCINSYIKNGHAVDLYIYSDVKNIPNGVNILNGEEILPNSMIFQYKEHKSFSAFSNYFRYKLLFEKGGYWSDTDQICLKNYDFSEKFVFSSEEVLPLHKNNFHINAGIIKTPKNSPVVKYAFEVCTGKTKDNLVWGEIGPKLVKECVEIFNLQKFVKSYNTFCPIAGCEFWKVLDPNCQFDFDDSVYGIHLWNEMWRRSNFDKNSKFDKNCLYEQLKEKYL